MSDLYTGNLPGATPGRQQDAPSPRITTPSQVMAARRARQAEQEAARQRQLEEEELRRRQTEEVVGVGINPTARPQQNPRVPVGEPASQHLPAGQSVTIGSRRPENIPTTNGVAGGRTAGPAVNQGQPRPVPAPQAGEDTRYGSQTQRDRTEAYEKLSMPAVAGTRPPQPQAANYPQTSGSTQPSGRSGFPHAFERWEMLSARWEGLTSFWISKLEQNTEEADRKPLDKQMSRQITDLSAAGANLFHAVVELQRLRASSERKFQRWFFETRNELEQAQERTAEMQRQLQSERQNLSESGPAIEAARAEKTRADELIKEMRRELQISKEEARRAWEELGRRVQEERERTTALRKGEPTMIGGVQVVPMQGLASRQNTGSQRPQTRDGPYQGGPGSSTMGGQQAYTASRSQTTLDSPSQEQAQFTYQPEGTSPTETDPFIETSGTRPRQALRHEPDTQFYHQATSSRTQTQPQPGVTVSAMTQSTARTQYPTAGHQRTQTAGTDLSAGPSYLPSTVSGNDSSVGEEEYHINPDGTYTRDAQGRRIPYRQPIGDYEEYEEGSDDDDHAADVERERLLAQQYQQRQYQPSQAATVPRTTSGNIPAAPRPPTFSYSSPPQAPLVSAAQESSPGDHSSSTISPNPPRTAQQVQSQQGPADYEGDENTPSQTLQPTGWEAINVASRHRHPTRLSDILEERTSPSRGSYVRSDDEHGQGLGPDYQGRSPRR